MKKSLSFTAILGILLSSFSVISAERSKIERPAKPDTQLRELRESRRSVKDTATEFARIETNSEGKGVLLKWQMGAEAAILGYRIYRIGNGDRTLVDQQPVYGSFSRAGRYVLYGEEYSYFDSVGEIGSVYEIEAQDHVGNMTRSGLFAATYGKLPNLKGSDIPGTSTSRSNINSRISTENIAPPKEVLAEMTSQFGQDDPDKHKWVMSNPGVRIDVKKEGIYRVTFAQLQAGGFDTNTDPVNWQLYVRGIEQAIRVSTGDAYIEFFGKGVDTQEADIQGYFLLNGPSAGKRMSNVVTRPPSNGVVLSGYSTTQTYKERQFYVNTIFNGDAENYFGSLPVDPNGRTISFDLKGVDFSRPTSDIYVKLQGYSTTLHSVQVTLNGQVVGTMDGVSQFVFDGSFSFPTALLKDQSLGQGSNALHLISTGGPSDNSLFDSFTVSLNRKHKAEGGTIRAYSVNSKVTRLRGFDSAAVRVFDITNENEPRLMTDLPFQAVDGAFGTDLPAARPKIIFAVQDTALLSPWAITVHDSEVLGSTTHAAEFVVISNKAFLAEANTWGVYRAIQGVSTKVIDVDEIINEFNYGVLSPNPIESFLSYAYNNWQTQPKYVLLIGDASIDSRNYLNVAGGPFNLVPTRIVTTAFSETGSDEALADFDNDGLAEMAVGRIPARVPATVTTAFNKTFNWETNLLANPPLSRGALFAYDVPNGWPFRTTSEGLRDELGAGVSSTMVGRGLSPPANEFTLDPNARANLESALNSGKQIVNYAGHGSVSAWVNSQFFATSRVPLLTNANNEAVFTMLTCLNGYFLGTGFPSLAEELLNATNGGAVAAWASSGLTTPNVQEQMGRRFYNQVGQGQIERIGDLIDDAKTVLPSGSDVRLSWVLIGDPMLKMN